ncbi:MAG: hypothetical protein ACREFX_01290, partial [Opitutaceae bacterium]
MIGGADGAPGEGGLCGLWVDGAGRAWVSQAAPDGRRRVQSHEFRPFAWLADASAAALRGTSAPWPDGEDASAQPGIVLEELKGDGPFRHLAHAETPKQFDRLLRRARGAVDAIRPFESQFLLQKRWRLYGGVAFGQLRRCQIEVVREAASGGVLAIGLRCGAEQR